MQSSQPQMFCYRSPYPFSRDSRLQRSQIDLEVIQAVLDLKIDKTSHRGRRREHRWYSRRADRNGKELANRRVFMHVMNQGKGAALQTGFRLAEGEIIIVQDADLEYNPEDYLEGHRTVREGRSQVAFGSRYLESRHENSSTVHRFGNWCHDNLLELLNGQSLTDMETCYKAFGETFSTNHYRAKAFRFEPEITAKLARKNVSIHESTDHLPR